MNIVVCIKQVPDTSEISINPETGTLNRAGVESVINPLDFNALEEALRLRARHGGTVCVLTMGPGQAEEALREALAMGADSAALCSDKKFAGADTWATACTLKEAVGILGIPDLILCGKQAIDGDTAQVPAELAVRLGLPFLPYVSEINSIREGGMQVTSMTESGTMLLETSLPAVCSVVKSINVPRLISLSGWIRAASAEIRSITRNEIDIEETDTGLQGSPTRVKKITPVSHSKTIQYLETENEKDLETVCSILDGVKDRAGREKEAPRSPDRSAVSGTAPPDWKALPLSEQQEAAGDKDGFYILGEIDPGSLRVSSVTYELLAEGKRLAAQKESELHLVLPCAENGINLTSADMEELNSFHLSSVVRLETGLEEGFEANCFAEAAASFLALVSPDIVFAPATPAGRSYVPLVASRLKTGLTADCTHFDIDEETGLLRQTRPAFGGNIMATIITPEHKPQMATVRPHVLQRQETPPTAAELQLSASSSETGWFRIRAGADSTAHVGIDKTGKAPAGPEMPLKPAVNVIRRTKSVGATEDIGNASIIISGGRGVGGDAGDESRGFPLLQRLARLVGGSVGASRSTVEAGWAPYHQQVGQTGKTVQPKVYIACGISGAVQHLVGMHDSDTVIAINKDPEAPIFQAADYGFVDDYSRVLQKLIDRCSQKDADS